MSILGTTIAGGSSGIEFIPNGANSAVTGEARLFFAPKEGLETVADKPTDLVEMQYRFAFSQLIDNIYLDIPIKEEYEASDPPYFYYGEVAMLSGPENLVITGDHIFGAWPPKLTVPTRATHVELWHRETGDMAWSLVRRVPLDSFGYWRSYFKPIIDQNCNDEC